MIKLSHKGMCTSPFGIVWIHTCFKKTSFCQHLSYKLPTTVLILPCALRSTCSILFGRKRWKSEGVWSLAVAASYLQWCQMQHAWKKFVCALTRGKTPPDLSSKGKAEMKPLPRAVRAPRLLSRSCRHWWRIAQEQATLHRGAGC